MVAIRDAVANAAAFAETVLGSERVAGVRVEEVESAIVGDEEAWLITLSMVRPEDRLSDLGAALRLGKREYKSFAVRKRDGEVTSMKIRELTDA